MTTFKFKYDRNGRARIDTDNRELFDRLRDGYTIPNKAARYSPFAPDTLSPITAIGSFLSGLTKDFAVRIKELEPDVNLVIEQALLDVICPLNYEGEIEQPLNKEYVYWDYQDDAIRLGMENGRGNILLPTSAGKGLIIYGLARHLIEKCGLKKIFVLVPGTQLVKQLYKDLQKYGMPEGITMQMFSGFSPDFDENVNITFCNRQWLETFSEDSLKRYRKKLKQAKVKEKKDDIQFTIDNIIEMMPKLQRFDSIIVDEVHTLKKKNKISNYVKNLPTNVRFGLTGTMPDDPEDEWNVKGLIGPVLITKKAYELQETGNIANVNIVSLCIHHMTKPVWNLETYEDFKKAYHTEWKYLEGCEDANLTILSLVENLPGNALILFDHTEHGQYLYENCKCEHKYFINGTIDVNVRENIRSVMENTRNVKTFANTKCFGVGISINAIDHVVFTMHGKSSTKIIQAIGRGLRLHELKENLTLWDIYHNFKYSIDHAMERAGLYFEHYQKEVDIKNAEKIFI